MTDRPCCLRGNSPIAPPGQLLIGMSGGAPRNSPGKRGNARQARLPFTLERRVAGDVVHAEPPQLPWLKALLVDNEHAMATNLRNTFIASLIHRKLWLCRESQGFSCILRLLLQHWTHQRAKLFRWATHSRTRAWNDGQQLLHEDYRNAMYVQ